MANERVWNSVKWDTVLLLAQQGFKAQDIVELLPSNIKVVDGKTIVSVNGKLATLALNESRVIAKYVNENIEKITEVGRLFFGKNAEYTVDQVMKSFRGNLKKYHPEVSWADLGWTVAPTPAIQTPIETMEDCENIFAMLKPIDIPKATKKHKEPTA